VVEKITQPGRSAAPAGGLPVRLHHLAPPTPLAPPVITVFSERDLMFMFAICRHPFVCRLSVTFVHPTQPIEIFGNVSAPFNTLVTQQHPGKILRRSSQKVVEKCSDFGPFRGYISDTVQDRR